MTNNRLYSIIWSLLPVKEYAHFCMRKRLPILCIRISMVLFYYHILYDYKGLFCGVQIVFFDFI